MIVVAIFHVLLPYSMLAPRCVDDVDVKIVAFPYFRQKAKPDLMLLMRRATPSRWTVSQTVFQNDPMGNVNVVGAERSSLVSYQT